MNWINPKDLMPEENQLIWIIFVNHRLKELKDISNYIQPYGNIRLAKTFKDSYGVIRARIIDRYGHISNEEGNFFRYSYWFEGEKFERVIRQIKDLPPDTDLVHAWYPYKPSDMPCWNPISHEESVEILKNNSLFSTAIQKIKTNARNSHFFSTNTQHPVFRGRFVVITSKQMSIVEYDPNDKGLWKDREGEMVLYWYPIPDYYYE